MEDEEMTRLGGAAVLKQVLGRWDCKVPELRIRLGVGKKAGCHHLRDLDQERPTWRNEFRMVLAFEVVEVEVSKIVGSVGHGNDFREDWVPLVEEDRDRFVLESFRTHGFDSEESARSPISLLECCGEYFVESDGHRRVSAAHRLKLRAIEAEVYRLERKLRTEDGCLA